jgi:splicing factor 1
MAIPPPNYNADLFAGSEQDGPRRRKKRNRWGEATENKAAGLMGLPTAIVADMTSEQLEAYTLHLRIEEITQKLKIDDVVPADGDRYVFALWPLLGSCGKC